MPDATLPYRNPAFPPSWRGGAPVEVAEPSAGPSWYDEARHAPPDQVALYASWAPLEDLTTGDAPEAWGFDVASAGAGGGRAPKRVQTLRGVVRRVSATGSGLVLEEAPDEWLNTSRFHPVDLAGVGSGDLVEVDAELGANGKRYLHRIARVDAEPGA
jgi:hypothetical protein